MNKYCVPAIIVLGISALASCGNKSTEEAADGVAVTSFPIAQSIKSIDRTYRCEGGENLFDSLPTYSRVSISVQWPEQIGDYNLNTLTDSLLKQIFASPRPTVDASIAAAASNPEGTDMFPTMTPVDTIPSEPVMILTRTINSSAVTINMSYVVYGTSRYVFSGGAHGMSTTSYLTYDLKNGQLLDRANTFVAGSEGKLLEAIKNSLMQDNNVDSVDRLSECGYFPDQIFVTDNFYLDRYDIVFHYNPYDIAPYSTGSVNVRVASYLIDDCLTEQVKQLIASTTM